MSINQEVDALRSVPILRNVDVGKLRLLAFISERVVYRAGEILCQQGDMGDSAFIILDGACAVEVETGGGAQEVAVLKTHDIVGEISILCDIPRTATVRAKEDTQALSLSKDQLFGLMREFPEVAFDVLRVLGRRLERTTQELAQMQGRS